MRALPDRFAANNNFCHKTTDYLEEKLLTQFWLPLPDFFSGIPASATQATQPIMGPKQDWIRISIFLNLQNIIGTALSFFEFVKSSKFHKVSELIFLLCNENLNSFLTRVLKLVKGGNYSREETFRGNNVD